MPTETEIRGREIVLVEDAHIRPMMGIDVLESTWPRSDISPSDA